MSYPAELLYTSDHEWIRIEGDVAYVGITSYATDQLGDIVYVEIETVGETIDRGEVFGSVEAVKTVSDLFMPIKGEVLEFNEKLEETPETVNEDPYGEGWMIKLRLEESAEEAELLSVEAYAAAI
ncbi:MAG: glycine cleavage system protein GcvH [Bacteroidota bacterium]